MTRRRILAFLCVATVIAYVQRSALSVPVETIKSDLGIGTEQMGLVMGAWYWSYAALQIPSGWLADRLGSRRTLTAYAATWSLLTGAAAFAGDGAQLLILWSLMGAAQAGIFPSATKAIADWFDPAERGRASGFLVSSQALGFALAPGVTAQILTAASWRHVLAIYAIPGVIWAALYFYRVPERNASSTPQPAAPLSNEPSPWRLPAFLLCGQQFLRAGAMVFFQTWFPTYLQEVHRLDQLDAGRLAVVPGVGALIGGLTGGFASDWILRRTGNRRLSRQGIAVAGMVVCGTLFLASRAVDGAVAVVALMTVGAFAATCGGVSGYAVAIDLGGKRVGTVFSVMNTCGNIGAGLFPYVVGWLLKTESGWDTVVLLIGGLFFADGAVWAFLNPSQPGSEVSP